MPLYKTIEVNTYTSLKIWKIEESYSELIQPLNLTPKSKERVLSMKSEIHQRGFLSVRHILKTFGYTDKDLVYDTNGKPSLTNGKQISITHSFNYSGVIISDKPVGIDIEKQRDKITVIAKKFVDYEFNYLKSDTHNYVQKLTIIWCIKESLYKLFATKGMLFKEHFLVIPFEINDGETIAWIDYKNKKHRCKSNFIEFDGFTCAYVL